MFLLNSAGFHKQMHLTYVKIISKLVVLWSRFAIRFVAPNEWDDGWCQHTCVCDILVTFNNSGNIIVIINHNNLTNIVVYHTRIHTLHTLHTLHYITLHYIHYITLHYITLHYITLHYITLHCITCMHGMHTYIHTYTYTYTCIYILYLDPARSHGRSKSSPGRQPRQWPPQRCVCSGMAQNWHMEISQNGVPWVPLYKSSILVGFLWIFPYKPSMENFHLLIYIYIYIAYSYVLVLFSDFPL